MYQTASPKGALRINQRSLVRQFDGQQSSMCSASIMSTQFLCCANPLFDSRLLSTPANRKTHPSRGKGKEGMRGGNGRDGSEDPLASCFGWFWLVLRSPVSQLSVGIRGVMQSGGRCRTASGQAGDEVGDGGTSEQPTGFLQVMLLFFLEAILKADAGIRKY